MENKFIHAIYDDDDKLIDAVKALKSGGVYIERQKNKIKYKKHIYTHTHINKIYSYEYYIFVFV